MTVRAPTEEPGAGSPAPKDLWRGSFGAASIRAAQLLLLLGVAVVAVLALIRVRLVVVPVLLALILAAAIRPFVSWLRSRGRSELGATVISFLLLALVVAALVTGTVVAVVGQADELASGATEGLDELYALVQHGPVPIDDAQIRQAREWAVGLLTSSTAGAGAITSLGMVGTFAAGTLLTIVILFFLLKDGEEIWAFVLRAFSGHRLVQVRRVGSSSMTVLGGYVRGTAIVALVDSVFIGLALVLFGVPLAVPLAVMVFLGAFFPIVGATLVGLLAALIALVANGPFIALMVVIVVVVVNQIEGNLLVPIVMGRALRLHALAVLLALAGGAVLAGVVGAVLAVPVVAVAWAAVKAWNQGADDRGRCGCR